MLTRTSSGTLGYVDGLFGPPWVIKSVIGAFCKRRRGSSSGSTPPGLKGPVEACGAAPQGVGRRRSARGQAQARANAAESAQARVGAVMRHSRPARPCPHRAESRYLPTSSDLTRYSPDIHLPTTLFHARFPRSSTFHARFPGSSTRSASLPTLFHARFPRRSSTLAFHALSHTRPAPLPMRSYISNPTNLQLLAFGGRKLKFTGDEGRRG